MAIGDGHLCRDSYSKSGKIVIRHSTKQIEWLYKKHKLIISLIGGHKPKIVEFNNSGYPGVYFSKTSKYFRVLRKWLYPNGIKFISRFLLDKLDLEGIAIWYMDDGGLSAKRRNGKVHAYELFLNTHLSRENNQIIIDYFNEVWNVKFQQVKNKGSYRLRMSTLEIRKFLPLIEKYIIPSMQYKVTMNYK